MINKELLIKQNVSNSQLEAIYELHEQLEVLINQSYEKNLSDEQYKQLGKSVEAIEFKLQENWNFKKDSSFHTQYKRLNGCNCPSKHKGFVWVNNVCKYHEK